MIDSAFFTGSDMSRPARADAGRWGRYEDLARRLGIPSRSVWRTGTDVVEEVSDLCLEISREYPKAIFFAGELVFEEPKWYHRFLHNDTSYAIQRRIRFAGIPMVIIPVLLSEA